jgi:hypothetical protein
LRNFALLWPCLAGLILGTFFNTQCAHRTPVDSDGGTADLVSDGPVEDRSVRDAPTDRGIRDSSSDRPTTDSAPGPLDTAPPDTIAGDQYQPATSWAISAGGLLWDYAAAVAVDSAGNSHAVGAFGDKALFGPYTLATQKGLDPYAARIDAAGKVSWATSFGGTNNERGTDVAVDASGAVYVIGNFFGTMSLGTASVTSMGKSEMYVAKLDSASKVVWVSSAGGAGYDVGLSIALDTSGSVYVTGAYVETATFGKTVLKSLGDRDVYVAKLDKNGKFIWASSMGGTVWEGGIGIAVDASSNSYVTGRYTGAAKFGSANLVSKGKADLFVAKLGPGGAVQWATSLGGPKVDSASAIGLDGVANSYLTGSFSGKASFGNVTLSTNGSGAAFVAMLDSAGKVKWATLLADGAVANGASLDLDSSGSCYITGSFGGKVKVGSTWHTSKGFHDVLIAKVSNVGKILWSTSAGGPFDDYGFGIAASSGSLWVTGEFAGTAAFGSSTLTSSGKSDIFVWRFK